MQMQIHTGIFVWSQKFICEMLKSCNFNFILTSLGMVTWVVVFPPEPPPPLLPPVPEPNKPGFPNELGEELFQPFLSPPPEPPKRDGLPPPPPFKGDLELFPNGLTNGGLLLLPKGAGLLGPRPNGAGRLPGGASKDDLLLKLKQEKSLSFW